MSGAKTTLAGPGAMGDGSKMPILTDAHGRPFERPEPPPSGADSNTRIAYLQAVWALRDAASECANRAFVEQFRAFVEQFRASAK